MDSDYERKKERAEEREYRKSGFLEFLTEQTSQIDLKKVERKLRRLAGFPVRKSRREILNRILHIFLFPAVFVYFEILLRIFGGTGIFSHLFYPIMFGIASGLFCACITSFFPRRINRGISMFLLFGSGLIFIVECLVKDSFQVYMTFKSILFGAGGVVGDFASELFSSIFHGIPVILLFFLPGILYVVLGKKKLPARRQKGRFIVMVLVCAVFFQGCGAAAASIGGSRPQYKTQFEFDSATQWFGLLTSLRLNGSRGGDAGKSMEFEQVNADASGEKDDKKAKEEDKVYGDNVADLDFDSLIASAPNETVANLHNYVKSQTPSKKNKYTGLFEGKNLILICAEALSDVAVNKELTPTLYRLIHNGIYMSDFYQPTWGGSTSSGEYSFLMGIAPMNGAKSMLQVKDNNLYYTMGNQLQRKGYFSRAYHNGNFDFYSRDLTHTNLGYEQWIAHGNGMEDIAGNRPRDTVMFDKTMDTYMDQQPFSIYYMSISGHSVYVKDRFSVTENLDKVEAVYGDKYKDTTKYYLCYQMELDHALEKMVEKLEAAGIAEDTVIAICSDHYPYGLEKSSTFGNNEDYVTDLYGYKYSNSWEQDHNSCVIWSGCLENENKDMACEISAPTYSLDILPTLCNLFGLEYDSRLLVGRDVLSDAEPLVLWNNYSWITDKGKYNAKKGEFIPNKGEKVDEEYIKRIKSTVANKLTYSTQVVDTDYFHILFGNK